MPWGLRLLGVLFAAAAAACALLAGSVRGAPSADCPLGLQVRWSPDGTRLVFEGPLNPRQQNDRGYGIVGIVHVDGTSPRVLSRWPFQHRQDYDTKPHWAPDGRSVVYQHMVFTGTDRHGRLTFARVLIQVDLRTGARFVVRGGFDPTFGPHQLTYIAPQGVFVNRKLLARGKFDDARWSANGKQLLLTVKSQTTYKIADANGRVRRVMRRAYPVAWEPHGNRIAYLTRKRRPYPNDTHLYISNADGSHRVRLWGGSVTEFHWAPDGRHIAYTAADGLRLAAADGSNQLLLGPVDQFVWSPDGRHIAFIPPSNLPDDAVFVANADGSHPVVITGLSTTDSLLWSPDSTRLMSGDALVDLATSDVIGLPGFGDAWSPDSSFVAADAGDGIDIVRADGTSVRHISLCTS
jgi:hypothetical protein